MIQLNRLSVVLILLSRNLIESKAQDKIDDEESTEASKIFVDPITNSVNFIKPPLIKPTTAQVAFEAGVPPAWMHPTNKPPRPTKPTRPNRPTKYTNRPARFPSESEATNNIVTEVDLSSKPLLVHEGTTPTYPPGVLQPEPVILEKEPDRGVVDWFLGLVGIKPSAEQTEPPATGPAKACTKCTCGVTYKHNRIVGGVETKVNEYPWMAYLLHTNRFYCGASLINNKYLLTAGHCVNGFSPSKLSAVFLDHDRSSPHETPNFTRRITKIMRHRSYGTGGSYNHDIALLQLAEEVPFSGIMKPVCLPSLGRSFTGLTGIVTGWGATQSHGQVSNKLREVHVPIWSNEDCKKKSKYGNKITDYMICAGYQHGTKDSCQGDSGGPMHIVNETYYSIVGIVSWGEGCAEPNYPGVYTRVNRYISWIIGNTKDACYCYDTNL